MKLRIGTAALVAATLLAAAPASANEKGKTMGLRFEGSLAREFNLVGSSAIGAPSSAAGTYGSGAGLTGGSAHGDVRVGYDLPFGLTPLIGLGYRSVGSDLTATPPEGDAFTSSFSGSEFVLALELRYYFKKHKKGLQPFGFAEYNVSFLSASVEAGDPVDEDTVEAANEDLEYTADENNHGEINFGLGMEYKFSKAFAVGGKWGFGIGLQGGTRNTPAGGDDQTVVETSVTTFGTSQAVYAAWRM